MLKAYEYQVEKIEEACKEFVTQNLKDKLIPSMLIDYINHEKFVKECLGLEIIKSKSHGVVILTDKEIDKINMTPQVATTE